LRKVNLRRNAVRDLRGFSGPERKRLIDALRLLGEGAANLDVKALRGASPWLRLRVGDYRVLYYPTTDTYEVDRIVHRRELDRAARTLGVVRTDDD
jgi:mRNA-degrading endonuclease RelE of RelBE toxin-antitoxin system